MSYRCLEFLYVKKKFFYFLLFPFLYLQAHVSVARPIDVIDDLGHHIQLINPAKRIISLAPDISEILFAIGAGQDVKGVVKGSDYPESSKQIPVVGSAFALDLERLASLKPDLIVMWACQSNKQIELLKTLEIPIYMTQPKRLSDVARTMMHLGTLTGHEKNASLAANNYLQELRKLKLQYHHAKSVNVFYQIGAQALFTINKDSWINQAIELCGGHNIFADNRLVSAEVDMEAVISRAPEVMISDSQSHKHHANWQNRWQAYPEIPAVRQKKLFSIDPDLIDRAGPRLAVGVAKVCHFIDQART